MKKFCDLKCTVTPHSSLNVSKGIVRCPALNKQTDDHILEFMKEQGVTAVRRIKDIHLANMAWWLKSAGALNFALSQEQCPISEIIIRYM